MIKNSNTQIKISKKLTSIGHFQSQIFNNKLCSDMRNIIKVPARKPHLLYLKEKGTLHLTLYIVRICVKKITLVILRS